MNVILIRCVLVCGAAAMMTLALATASHACSVGGFPARRATNIAHFIAIPLADTVFAGAGTVRYRIGAGHFGSGRQRSIYGQLLDIERIGGLANRALGRSVRRVVVVPWDYGEDCTPVPWTTSAAWATVGTRGLFSAILRDSAQWAGGIPTFDIFYPQLQPYPQELRRQLRGRELPPDSIVPMEELFDLIELLPDEGLLPDSAESAVEALFTWARANPTRTNRYPIANMLSAARNAVARQRLRAIKSPIVGTYRFTVSLSGSPPRTFYARTRGFPISEWNADRQLQRHSGDPTIVPFPDGYTLLTAVSESLATLPRNCEGDRDAGREGYMSVAHLFGERSADARSWSGALEVSLAERAFPHDTALGRFADAVAEASYRRFTSRAPSDTPARFVRSADGTIHVEQRLTVDDGRSLTMSGSRISAEIVACRW